MNRKAQGFFIGIMIFVSGIIVLFQMVPFLKDEISAVRQPENLDCDNSSITTMTKATCVVTDTTLFAYAGVGIGALLSIIGGGLVLRRAKS